MLVFLHIPKTAGTSLHHYISQFYHENDICAVNQMFPNANKVYSSSINYNDFDRISKYEFVWGHISYLFCQNIPNANKEVITVLRDPVDCVLSTYKMMRWGLDPHLNEELQKVKDIADKGLEYFLASDYFGVVSRIHNIQTLHLNGEIGLSDQDRASFSHKTSDTLMKSAVQNLNCIKYVGTCEELPRFLQLLSWHKKWPVPEHIPQSNISEGKKIASEEYNETAKELIQKHISLDTQLYEDAKLKFWNDYHAVFGERTYEQANEMIAQNFDKELATKPIYTGGRVITTMASSTLGSGWYGRESDFDGSASRWTGPGTVSNLYIKVQDKKNYLFYISISETITESIVENSIIKINGHIISIYWQNERGYIFGVGYVSQDCIGDDLLLKVEIETNETFSLSAAGKAERDHRKCGLRVRNIQLLPAIEPVALKRNITQKSPKPKAVKS